MSLKSLRDRQGLTQGQIADRAGIVLRQYQRYESGEAPLTKALYKTVIALAETFHLSPEELIRLQSDEPDDNIKL